MNVAAEMESLRRELMALEERVAIVRRKLDGDNELFVSGMTKGEANGMGRVIAPVLELISLQKLRARCRDAYTYRHRLRAILLLNDAGYSHQQIGLFLRRDHTSISHALHRDTNNPRKKIYNGIH